MSNQKYIKKFITGSFYVFIFSSLSAGLNYLLRFILAANLTIADYGLFYASLSLINLVAVLRYFGLHQSLAYYISKFKAENKLKKLRTSIFTAFSLQILITSLITLVIFLYSENIVINYFGLQNISQRVIIIKLLAGFFFINMFVEMMRVIARGFQKMRFFVLIDFLRMFFWVTFTCLLLWFNYSVFSPIGGILISCFLVILIFLKPILKLIPKTTIKPNKKLTKKLISYGIPLMISGFIGTIIASTDTILITIFKTLEDVGIYQTAQSTSRLLWLFSGSLIPVLFPLVTEIETKKGYVFKRGVELIYKYLWIILIPFALMLFFLSTEILNLFFGKLYIQGSLVLKIFALGAIFFSITQINGTILNGIGKPTKYTKVAFKGMIINLIGNLILIPLIGIIGAAISTLLTYFIMLIFSFFELRRFIKIEIPVFDWIKTLFAGFISISTIYFLKSFIIASLLLEIFVCFLSSMTIFTILLILLKVINTKEVFDLIKQIIK
jgi:O-antigen/teichoic acid export membrane protein